MMFNNPSQGNKAAILILEVTGFTEIVFWFVLLIFVVFVFVVVARFLFALCVARAQPVGVLVLLGTIGAIDEFAIACRLALPGNSTTSKGCTTSSGRTTAITT